MHMCGRRVSRDGRSRGSCLEARATNLAQPFRYVILYSSRLFSEVLKMTSWKTSYTQNFRTFADGHNTLATGYIVC